MKAVKIIVVLFIVVASPTTLAADADETNTTDEGLVEEGTIQVTVDGTSEITPRIENPLRVEDNITLKFSGRALSDGIIDWDVTETDQLKCDQEAAACNLSIPAQSSQEVKLTLTGTMVGQADLVVEGTSKWTQLTGEDSVQVSVLPRTSEGVREASGVSPIHLFVLALLGSLVLYGAGRW